MKRVSILIVAATLNVAAVAPAFSQVVIYGDQYSDPYSGDRNAEASFLHAWNRNHDAENRWYGRRANFGPDDVISLLEDRGYRVRNIEDVGERYLVQASRGGDDLLVSVSRSGDIMGVVHDRR